MPASLFDRWATYFSTNPFDEERADLRAASICVTMANMWSEKKFKLEDFLLDFGNRKKIEQTWQQQRDMFKALAEADAEVKKRRTTTAPKKPIPKVPKRG